MCGIAGIAGFRLPDLVPRMIGEIGHRGPDGHDTVELTDAEIELGICRLAIIDPEHGDQPMQSDDGRVHIVFNGEIYNCRELGAELESAGYRFKSRCDTEVVLAAYLTWGQSAWPKLRGMFAFAIADRREGRNRLLIVRDRYGIKPLYFCSLDSRLVFASEMKAILLWQDLPRAISRDAIASYMQFRFVGGQGTLFKNIRKLPAGNVLSFENGTTDIRPWYHFDATAAADQTLSYGEAVERYRAALTDAVTSHTISDRPLGAYLSGGIDSNAIAALLAQSSSVPIKTYTIGFHDFPRDEADTAAETATALGADHTEIMCRASDMASLGDIIWHLDEPIGDPIIVPMYVLAREASREVKVVLSGEGADESLGGYLFHRKLRQVTRLQSIPKAIWHVGAFVIGHLPPSLLDHLFDYPGQLGVSGRRKLVGLMQIIPGASVAEIYDRMISLFDAEELRDLLIDIVRLPGHDGISSPEHDILRKVLALQMKEWLPDDILMKLDKTTMAHGLEGRVPYMDHKVVEAAMGIPEKFMTGNYGGKRLLRDAVGDLLPARARHAPKKAFYIPLDAYAETPMLREIFKMTLDRGRLKKRGIYNLSTVSALETDRGSAGFMPLRKLFAIASLELWFERFCPDAELGGIPA